MLNQVREILAWVPGGAEGNRTPDLLIANEALYHLSYGPRKARNKAIRGRCVKPRPPAFVLPGPQTAVEAGRWTLFTSSSSSFAAC